MTSSVDSIFSPEEKSRQESSFVATFEYSIIKSGKLDSSVLLIELRINGLKWESSLGERSTST